MEEEKESLGGHPDGQQEGTSRDSQHCERAEIMIARLSPATVFFLPFEEATQARWDQSTKSMSAKERRRISSAFNGNRFTRSPEQLLLQVSGLGSAKSRGRYAAIGCHLFCLAMLGVSAWIKDGRQERERIKHKGRNF